MLWSLSFLVVSATVLLVSSAPKPDGQVLQIVDIKRGSFVFHEDNLALILSKIPSDTEVGIISIAGEYRKGKSFLLNYFLQYLGYRKSNDAVPKILVDDELEDAIESSNHPWLKDIQKNSGFNFRSGGVRDTTGVKMWSEPFAITTESGKKIAILVMDSQGLYDPETSMDDNIRLFTMVTTMSSSVMINIPQNLNYNQLRDMQFFVKYASSGQKLGSMIGNRKKMFQTLTFVIRDYMLESGLGWEQGQKVLDMFMNPATHVPMEIKNMTQSLKNGFSHVNAFALPYPGNQVTRSKFGGKLDDIERDFLEQLQRLVIDLVEKTDGKKTISSKINAGNYVDFVRNQIENFNKKISPEEMVRAEERQLANSVRTAIWNIISDHQDSMVAVIKAIDESYWKTASQLQIEQLVDDTHEKQKESDLEKAKKNTLLQLYVGRFTNGKLQTGYDLFVDKMTESYKNVIRKAVIDIAVLKQKEIEIEERLKEAKRVGDQKRADDARRERNQNNGLMDEIEKGMEGGLLDFLQHIGKTILDGFKQLAGCKIKEWFGNWGDDILKKEKNQRYPRNNSECFVPKQGK